MYRVLLALGLGLLAATAARADFGPPKGGKSITVDHKITTAKAYPDYAFYTIFGNGKAAKITAVKLDPKTPIEIKGAGNAGVTRVGYLVAVPKNASKAYGTEKEFHEALKIGKVEGFVQTKGRLDSTQLVKDTDKRARVLVEHKLTSIDAKNGIVLDTKKGGPAPGKPEEEAAPGVTAYTPRGGLWVAGAAAFAALTLGGLWVAGRSRRKV